MAQQTAPPDNMNCQLLADIERVKKFIYPDELPGESVTPDEFDRRANRLLAWRDQHANHLCLEPLADFKELILLRRRSVGTEGDVVSDSALTKAAYRADGSLNRCKAMLKKMPKASLHNNQTTESGRPSEPPLTKTQRRVLLHLLKSEAFTADQRQTTEEIAEAIGLTDTVKKAASALCKLELLRSKRGSGGGYWLTEAGRQRAEQLSK